MHRHTRPKLIFFIVAATFVKEIGLDVNQPNEEPIVVDPDKKPIVVRITGRDRILIGQRDIDWRSLRANIERLHAEQPEAPIMKLHPGSSTVLVHVIDSARDVNPHIKVAIADYR